MAEFETRQILIGHEFLWRALNVWARSQRLRLLRMEAPDAVPTYRFDVTSPGFHR